MSTRLSIVEVPINVLNDVPPIHFVFLMRAILSIYFIKSSLHCFLVSSGEVTVCPMVRSCVKIS